MCKRLRAKGMCKSRFTCIKNDLCKVTCGCNDILSLRSCKVLKGIKACSKNLAVGFDYCRWTCGFCWRKRVCKSAGALGMQNKVIPDSRITTSSYRDSKYTPSQGRLHIRPSRGKNGAWCTKRNQVGEWLQVDLGKISTIKGVATQGHYGANYWVKTYTLQYSNNGKTFKKYQGGKVFKGNSDKHSVVKHNLNPPIYARYISVVVKTWYSHICMRMELYGCKYY
ncbi:EGF-like repeat and discoidin I-like domain-containing protein 3 [Exaiptasia diaphana]|uniref:F5/8 type C domain-containing protein n=1 Tax=Exaiptasia diaphana TaxID=2652724 RepID=A0A913WZU1_EXADI|nr:EGF-like repeat and discoidin I-like domain-containing protein 3 [Exaiptasia diaphana]